MYPFRQKFFFYFKASCLACASFGPAVGYVVGGQILNIYVDFDSVSQ